MADGSRPTGHLWALVEQWRAAQPYEVSQRKLARKLGVSATTLSNWKYGTGWPEAESLQALADEIGLSYEVVLNAVLIDRGYRKPQSAEPLPRKRSVG